MISHFQPAARLLGAAVDHIPPGGQGLWNFGRIMDSLRRDAFGRLVIDSMGTVIGRNDRGLSQRWARKQLARNCPQLGPVEFEEAWSGKTAMTPDHKPRIAELVRGLFTAIGYNGRGITPGTIFGRALADVLARMNPADPPQSLAGVSPVPAAPLLPWLYQTPIAANRVLKSI